MLRKTNDQLADKSCKLLEKAEKKQLEASSDGSHEDWKQGTVFLWEPIASKEIAVCRREVCIPQKHEESITVSFWDKGKKNQQKELNKVILPLL